MIKFYRIKHKSAHLLGLGFAKDVNWESTRFNRDALGIYIFIFFNSTEYGIFMKGKK